MAGMPGRSGGQNKRSLESHLLAGSYRPDRHAHLTVAEPPAKVSVANRRRTLEGLTGPARRLALRLLAEYSGWGPQKLETLRHYARSCERLEALQQGPSDDTRALHREIRANLNLLRSLNLED